MDTAVQDATGPRKPNEQPWRRSMSAGDLSILPDCRRCGIGSTLLDAVCGEARLWGAERVVLEVASDNEAAHALYVGRGFTVVGRRRNYYRRAERLVDALILQVQLPTALLPT